MPTTVSLDKAIQALLDGYKVSHKCLPSTEYMYLDTFGQVLGGGGLCLLDGLDLDLDMFRERMERSFSDGWIIGDFRYGEPDEALEWMKQGGLARLPSNLKMDYCFWRDDMVYCRRTSGHEWRYASEPSWNFNQWTAEPYILLPPTCKKVTYEELKCHLEKGGRWQWRWHYNNTNQGCDNYWFYKNKDHHMFHHLHGKDLDVTLRYGEWGEGISVGNLEDVVLLPPLEEKPKATPQIRRLEPKTDATEETLKHLKDGGVVYCATLFYRWVDGRLQCKLPNASPDKWAPSAFGGDIERFAHFAATGGVGRIIPSWPSASSPKANVCEACEGEPLDKPEKEAEEIVTHLLNGGIVQVMNTSGFTLGYRWPHDCLMCTNKGAMWESCYGDDIEGFARERVAENNYKLITPPTRLEVIKHLRKGGKVRWRNGTPGHWGLRYDTLYWLPCGAKRAVVSKHNCDGHWFASFEDWEIEHLELLSKEPSKDSMTQDNPSPAEIIEHLLDGGTVRETTRKGRTAILSMLDGTIHFRDCSPDYRHGMMWGPVSELRDALRLAQKYGTRYELL